MDLPLSSSRRDTFCPSSALSGGLHRRLASGLRGGSSTSPSVRGVVEDGGFGPHKFSRIKVGPFCVAEPRVSCLGSVGLDSFGLHDRGIFHLLSGWNSFLVPVSVGLGPVGIVPLEENLPSGIFLSGRRQHCGGFSLKKGILIPSEWVFKCFGTQFSAPEILLPVPERSGLENGRVVFSLDESSSVRVSSFLSSPQDLGLDYLHL